jgi:hypothetical protein
MNTERFPGFTKRYGKLRLVYSAQHNTDIEAPFEGKTPKDNGTSHHKSA